MGILNCKLLTGPVLLSRTPALPNLPAADALGLRTARVARRTGGGIPK